MKRSGHADLPLHGGRVPAWLATRMATLGSAVAEYIVVDRGPREFLSRLSDPFWFQAFGAVLGMDWHSSGISTSVLSALKRGLNPKAAELGIYVCGGRGRQSRNTPAELLAAGDREGFNGSGLARISRLTARVDNNAIADGFQIYLHGFVVSRDGDWTVVQQGMNTDSGTARRYHWHSESVRDFTSDPHAGIVGENRGPIMNLVDARASTARDAMLDLVRQDPVRTLEQARVLRMPAHHGVRAPDVDIERLGAVLAIAHERELTDFAGLLLTEKLGPRTLQSLALVAEVVHGTPTRFSDPARFSFAHGGKDGHPFPVPLKVYDQSIDVLRSALDRARLGDTDKLEGFRRLNGFVQAVEQRCRPSANFDAALEHERAISPALGGRTVFDDARRKPSPPAGKQLSLW